MQQGELYRVETIRELEARAARGLPSGELMRRAGRAAAVRIAAAAGTRRRMLVLCGPGNNGGDGFVCAAELAARGLDVTVALAHDPAARGNDARDAFARLPDTVRRTDAPDASGAEVIVDALFGIGLDRPVEAPWAGWIEDANRRDDALRVALDLPSGLDADGGLARGTVFRAHRTITFLADKPSLRTGDGPDFAGAVDLEPLVDAVPDAPAPDGLLDGPQRMRSALVRLARGQNSHKGLFGTVALVGGSAGLAGALVLALRAALKTGAGRVRGGFVDGPPVPFDPLHPETMLTDAQAAIRREPSVIAIGPGLGDTHGAQAAVAAAIDADCPLLLDADALNIVARDDALRERCRAREAPVAITPHPLEAARLLGRDTKAVQADRLGCATELAASLGAATVLKGAGSVVAAPDGRWWINPTGSPALATGGSGDTLTGIVAALMGQLCHGTEGAARDEALLQALRLGVWLHGTAGQRAEARAGGPLGVAAGETIDHARHCLNGLVDAAVRRRTGQPRTGDAGRAGDAAASARARRDEADAGAPADNDG